VQILIGSGFFQRWAAIRPARTVDPSDHHTTGPSAAQLRSQPLSAHYRTSGDKRRAEYIQQEQAEKTEENGRPSPFPPRPPVPSDRATFVERTVVLVLSAAAPLLDPWDPREQTILTQQSLLRHIALVSVTRIRVRVRVAAYGLSTSKIGIKKPNARTATVTGPGRLVVH